MQEFTPMDKASLNLVTATDENAGWAIPQGTFRQETLDEKEKGTNGNATEQLDMFTNQCLKKIRIHMK